MVSVLPVPVGITIVAGSAETRPVRVYRVYSTNLRWAQSSHASVDIFGRICKCSRPLDSTIALRFSAFDPFESCPLCWVDVLRVRMC